ncbi:glycosyltransferase [bacterium]|nr:glycosyltransferase [bacterium]
MKTLRVSDNLPESLVEHVSEELARGGLWTAYSLETPTGLKAIDSPYEPRGEATRTLLKAGCKPGTPLLLLGSGSGYFTRTALEEGYTPALAVVRSRALLDANVKRINRRFADASEEMSLVADDDPARVWRDHVQPFLDRYPDAVIVRHPRETKAFPGFYGALDVHVARHHTAEPARATDPAIRRVLFVGSGGLYERELLSELQRRSIHVTHIQQTALTGLNATSALDLLNTHTPDLVLSTNNRGSDEIGLLPEACEQAGVAWATWLLDDPRFLLHPDEIHGAGRQRIGFCWDRNGIDGWRDAGFPNAHPLPLATDETLFKPGDGFAELTGRVVFVGSPRFASTFGFFAALDKSEIAGKAARALETEILRTRQPPAHERVDELLGTLDPEKTLDLEAKRRLPAYAVQQANLAYRVNLLNSLASNHLTVFGMGWEGLLDERIELREPLDFYTDLPKLYRTDAVHISLTNLQMQTHPNQRPFDVGACGRAVLNDDLAALPELFGAELADRIAFTSAADLQTKVSELIAKPSLRAEIGERMRKAVLEGHTVRHRVNEMLRVSEQRRSDWSGGK